MANQNINMVFGIQGHDVIARGMNKIETSVKKSTGQVDKMIQSLQNEYAQMTKSTRQLQVRRAALEGASKAQIDGIIALQKAIAAKQEESAEIAKANAQRDKEQAEYSQSQKAIQRIVTELQREHEFIGKTKDEIMLKKAAMAGATQAQLYEIQRLQKSNKAKEEAIKQTGGLTKHLRFMRGGFGQVGHQIQDVSVQLQMGTDAMLVFGQQGSQIASLFGGGGAMIGAIISVGAAISTYISASSVQAEKDLKEMKNEMVETAKKAGVLTDALKSFLMVELERELQGYKDQLIELDDKLEKANKSLQNQAEMQKMQRNALDTGIVMLYAMSKAYEKYLGNAKESEEFVGQEAHQRSELNRKIKETRDSIDRLNDGMALGKTKTDESIESLRDEIAVLQMQRDKQISAAQAQAIYNAMQDEELSQNPMLLEDRLQKIRTLFAEKKALEDLLNPQDDVNESNKKGATDAQKFALKVATMTEQLGLSRIELMRLQATHAANGDSALLSGFMAAIDEYEAKLKALNDSKKEEQDIDAAIGDFDSMMDSINANANAVDEYLKSDVDKFNDFYKQKRDALKLAIAMEEGDVAQHNANLIKLENDKQAQLQSLQMNVAEQSRNALMSQFQQLASHFDQTTGLGKAFYVMQQAMAASDAIMKGYQTASAIRLAYAELAALTANPSLTAVGETQASMAVGMGFATAGAIAGQTLASFEGGGITFSGVRSGGLDGKGGRLAVVHSNEKITDLEKDGSTGQPVNVQFTINAVDAKGIDQLLYERRGMITGIVQKAVNNVGRRIM